MACIFFNIATRREENVKALDILVLRCGEVVLYRWFHNLEILKKLCVAAVKEGGVHLVPLPNYRLKQIFWLVSDGEV